MMVIDSMAFLFNKRNAGEGGIMMTVSANDIALGKVTIFRSARHYPTRCILSAQDRLCMYKLGLLYIRDEDDDYACS